MRPKVQENLEMVLTRLWPYMKQMHKLQEQCHDIVCQLRPLMHNLGPNNDPSIRYSFALLKSHVKGFH
jgi:hypothetical protein